MTLLGLLGIRPDYDGLCINPKLPKEIESLQVKRKFRAAEYIINLHNSTSDELTIIFDGNQLDGNLLPSPVAGEVYHIDVFCGKKLPQSNTKPQSNTAAF